MVEGKLPLAVEAAFCWPGGILRTKLMAALGFVSARVKRPSDAAAEGGNGAGG